MMTNSAARSRVAAATAALFAVAVGTAGCTSQSTTTAAGNVSTTAASGGASGSGTPTSGAGSVAPATPATSSAAASGSGTGTPACGNHDLKISESAGGGGAMSHDGIVLIFTDISAGACTVQGYPGASVVNGSAVLANASRTLSGYLGDGSQALTSAPRVQLAPGASSSARLEWLADAGETCYAGGTGTLKVTPPNTTATTSLGPETVGSAGICAGLQVHPVVSGIIEN